MDKIQQNISAGQVQLTAQQKAKLKVAVKDFEAVFMQYMLKAMQETENIDGKSDNKGYGNGIMTGLFNMKLSEYMTKNSSLGIGSMLYKQLTGEEMDTTPAGVSQSELNDPVQGLPDKPQNVLQKIKAYSSGSLLENVGKYSDIINEAAGTYNLQSNR